MTTVAHPAPSRLSHLSATLYGREDDTLIAWRQACVQATDALRSQYAGERLSKALTLAQSGAVTLHEGGGALVKSGDVHYEVRADGDCNCTDHEKRGGACKHVLAVRIHTQTLALLEPSSGPWEPEPVAPRLPPGSATSTWNVQEAPTSVCVRWRIGTMDVTYTMRGTTDDEVLARLDTTLQRVHDTCEMHERRAAERAAAREAVLAPSPPATTMPALTPEAVQAFYALLAASNGAAANGHTATNGAPLNVPALSTPRCPAHGDMRESTKAPGTWFCTQKLPNGKYCPSKA